MYDITKYNAIISSNIARLDRSNHAKEQTSMTEQAYHNTGTNNHQHPTTNDQAEWRAYWQTQGQPWRKEPEITEQRQKQLAAKRAIAASVEQSVYPFGGEKLTRADVEWLLITHEQGRGPVDWSDTEQRDRIGLDLRGADLRGVDLRHLPLARLRAGITWYDSEETLTPEHMQAGGAQLERANLREAHLEGAWLGHVNLHLSVLHHVRLETANLEEVNLTKAVLYQAHLENADLHRANLEDAYLFSANLVGAQLQGAFFNAGTTLENTVLGEQKIRFVSLAGAHWGGVDLSVINWRQVRWLGDEEQARQAKHADGTPKDRATRLQEYITAVRANRQVAVALSEQGINEEAMRFAYHAQQLQRRVHLWERQTGRYLFSLFLNILAGYGYKPLRCFIAYACTILIFAMAYYLLGPASNVHLTLLDAIVFSMTSFHGRGFSPGQNIGLSNPLSILAALEAFSGVIIELTLIATLTQRLFNR
jgi:uncharacterized protein YjbI with pentapeptide repeats